MAEYIEPVYAQGFFIVTKSGLVHQVVIFDYYDPEGYYFDIMEDEVALNNEVEFLKDSMQAILDQEKVVINGARTKPKVIDVDIGFRSSSVRPFLTFFIIFKGDFKNGVNVYENWYESEEAEYDFDAYWFFPPGAEVLEVIASGATEIFGNKNILAISVKRRERITGYEKIVFKIS